MLLQINLNRKLNYYNLQFTKNLKNLLPFIEHFFYDHHTLNIVVKSSDLLFILTFFKMHTNLQYKLLTAIIGIDYPDRKKRFEIIYELLSIRYNNRIRIKILINEIQIIPSCYLLFSAATWWEREIWDMFGIFFDSNHEIKRLLTDYGFEGHPLRKDFPLSGYIEVRYNDSLKRIVYEPLEHAQHFRSYDFLLGW